MSEETAERNVENERADAVRKMMDQWKDGKLTDAQDTFNSMMNDRADSMVADRKAEVASGMFNQSVEEIDLPEPTAGEVAVPETTAEAEPETE
jgi:hypothetical protein